MQAKAVLRGCPHVAAKGSPGADVVRGKPVDQALSILRYMPQKAAGEIDKTIASAAANAENNFQMDRDDLMVKTIYDRRRSGVEALQCRARVAASNIFASARAISR